MLVTIGWKSVSPPAIPIRPAHLGSASAMTDLGSCAGVSCEVLYAITLTRADTPTHLPSGELNLEGVAASVDGSTGASRPLEARYCNGGEFSV